MNFRLKILFNDTCLKCNNGINCIAVRDVRKEIRKGNKKCLVLLHVKENLTEWVEVLTSHCFTSVCILGVVYTTDRKEPSGNEGKR